MLDKTVTITPMKVDQLKDRLIITIDISEAARNAAPLSKQGKARLVASTRGFVNYGEVQLSLNCICR